MITEEEWRLKLRERRALNEEEDDDVGTGGGVAVVMRALSSVVGLVGVGVERKENFDLRDFLSLRHALDAIDLCSGMKRTKGNESLVGERERENVRFNSMKSCFCRREGEKKERPAGEILQIKRRRVRI